MFRQHLVSCNCQLFSPHNYEFKEFRSPPSHSNRNQLRSKKSLKSQSHSRDRPLQHHQLLRKSQQVESQNGKNIKMTVFPSRLPSKLTTQSDYQFKIVPAPLAKISLLNNKNAKNQNHTRLKQNQAATCPVKSIKYQTKNLADGPSQGIEAIRDITINANLQQNNCIKLIESTAPIFHNYFQKYRQNSAQTTLAGSVAPSFFQYIDKTLQNTQYFEQHPKVKIQVGNKQGICEQKKQVRPITASNFFRLSRLSEMVHEKQEAESVYEGEKTHQQGGVEYSRVLISCKKLMEQKNGMLEDTHRTKLFDYYPEPSKRSDHSSTFQRINLLPSTLR